MSNWKLSNKHTLYMNHLATLKLQSKTTSSIEKYLPDLHLRTCTQKKSNKRKKMVI